MADTTQNKLQCIIVTPETTVLDLPVDSVSVPLYDGELGILPGRAPVVARLGYGELRTKAGTERKSYYIDSGFLQVRRNVITVLTPRAIPAAAIDAKAASAELDRANHEVPKTPEAFEAKTISLSRARAQLKVAKKKGTGSRE